MVITSRPAFRNKQAKVLLKTWGLQGRPEFFSNLLNIEMIPHLFRPQMLPLNWCSLNHFLRYFCDMLPKGASASFRPLPITLMVWLCQSISPGLMLAISLRRSPLSVNRTMMECYQRVLLRTAHLIGQTELLQRATHSLLPIAWIASLLFFFVSS